MQFATIVLGGLIFVFIFIFDKYNKPPDHIGFLLFLFVLVIPIPLFYLKAIKALLIERELAGADSEDTIIKGINT
jgi:hypothetical protein